ncbi:MAG: HTH domain-containing protein [Armatimonadota bacterium]|nr:HTH domain-containing protein [Armatimonadota bacterium]
MRKSERVALVVATLALRGRTSAGRLAEILGAPESTVYSDIRTLRRAGVPVHGEPGPGGGFALRPDHTDSDLRLAPRDAVLILLAAGALLSRPPVPAGAAAMRDSLRTALEALPKPLSEFRGAIWKITFAPPDRNASLYADVAELITEAIQAKLPLFLSVDGKEQILVTPESIRWNAKGWRLVARDTQSGKRMELNLEQIRAAHLDGPPIG